MSLNCGNIIDSCNGATYTLDSTGSDSYSVINTNFLDLVGEAIFIATSLQNIVLITASESLSTNMQKGLNGIRCASSNGLIDLWMLLASVYYAARQFGVEGEIQTLVNEAYPYLCTCKEDVYSFYELFGTSATTSAVFTTCA